MTVRSLIREVTEWMTVRSLIRAVIEWRARGQGRARPKTRPGPAPRFRVRLRYRVALLPGSRVGAGCDVQRIKSFSPLDGLDPSLPSCREGPLLLPDERDLSSFLTRGVSLQEHFRSLARLRAVRGEDVRRRQAKAAAHALLVRCSCAAPALLLRCTEGVLLASVRRDALLRCSYAAPALLMRCSYAAP
jgi:hypothetical protein